MQRHFTIVIVALGIMDGCRGAREQESATARKQAAPVTQIPSSISHGEAPIGSADVPPPIDPAAPARETARLHHVRIEIRHQKIQIDSDMMRSEEHTSELQS